MVTRYVISGWQFMKIKTKMYRQNSNVTTRHDATNRSHDYLETEKPSIEVAIGIKTSLLNLLSKLNLYKLRIILQRAI